MPIYEYQCDKCKKQFEVVTLSLSEKPKAVCPKCKSKKTSKIISRVGKGKYGALRSGGSVSSSAPSSSGCSSCSSSNCSSCGH
ncbi:MAG: FmdB family transcriptional regulator [Deltaproteobacteria bacterium HGW-Deltaproteobacteria-6]|nr:MAG: FmdB family transcriptional regulator [Deltaproteobacteria bacterium HGW-Deltaproteobacteria-6]